MVFVAFEVFEQNRLPSSLPPTTPLQQYAEHPGVQTMSSEVIDLHFINAVSTFIRHDFEHPPQTHTLKPLISLETTCCLVLRYYFSHQT